ncbi:MAG TPA: cupin domain-containing protein [Solirubrobacteraceae bacterium]|nr:cupin domain-containing protein [Solirubrobacteraceae bacterium]
MTPETYTFDDDGSIPNSSLPVLVYAGALDSDAGTRAYEELFAGNGWLGAWRDGIYPFHHFHSTAHEVLGIAAGSAEVMLGGPGGRRFELAAGDVVVLPAGTGHCNLGSSPDLLVVGAYPNGMDWDLCRRVTPIQRPVGRPPNAPRSHCARGTPYRRPRPSLKPPSR